MYTWYFKMFSSLLQAVRCILNSFICLVYFSNSFNSALYEKIHETFWCSSSIACQEKRTDGILRIFIFNDKNPLCLYIISALYIFWGSKRARSTPISHKAIFHIPKIQNSGFKLKKWQVFPNPILFSIYFFRQYLT